MIFTNNIKDLINVKTDCYLHNKQYSSTKLYKYYNAKFVGIEGKRVIIKTSCQIPKLFSSKEVNKILK